MAAPFFLVVVPTSGVPIYRQLVDQVRARVAGGRLRPGEFLPSVRLVAEHLQVNPMTVSKAYSILEREGVVELVRGQGMSVLPPGRAGDAKARERSILPLLHQVAEAALDLALSPQQVISKLEPLLKGADDASRLANSATAERDEPAGR